MDAVQGSGGFSPDDETPVFVISVAAQLAGMHAQTLRQYDRLGLVSPSRTRGGGRRYSARDVTRLREVQRLSQDEGVSLAGIQRILDLENQVQALRARVTELHAELETMKAVIGSGSRVPEPITAFMVSSSACSSVTRARSACTRFSRSRMRWMPARLTPSSWESR